MKTIFAFFGGMVFLLSVLGAVGIGNFVLIYSADKVTCTKETE